MQAPPLQAQPKQPRRFEVIGLICLAYLAYQGQALAGEPASTGLTATKAPQAAETVDSALQVLPQAPPTKNLKMTQAFLDCAAKGKKAAAAKAKASVGSHADGDSSDVGTQVQEACKADQLATLTAQTPATGTNGQVAATVSTATAMTAPACNWGADSCTSGDKILCERQQVRGVMQAQFYVDGTQTLVASTDNLAPIGTADTVLYLLRCTNAYCTDGVIAGIDDDGNGTTADSWDSRIEIPNPTPGKYIAYGIAYADWREGTGRLLVTGATTVIDSPNLPVGGWHINCKEIKYQDDIYVAKDPAGPVAGAQADSHDSVVTLLSTTSTAHCAGGMCGVFQVGDDTVYGAGASTLATRIRVGGIVNDQVDARIIVAPFWHTDVLRPRLMHVRRHPQAGGTWPSEDQRDLDGDSLPHELEAELGTCDVPYNWNPTANPELDTGTDIGILGMNCATYRTTVSNWKQQAYANNNQYISCSGWSCWDPKDSDHDGLRDDHEVFVAPVECDHLPSGPYRDAGLCAQLPIDQSCNGSKWCMVEPLSARSGRVGTGKIAAGPDPHVLDMFVVQDYFQTSAANTSYAEPAALHRLRAIGEDQLSFLENVFTDRAKSCWDGNLTSTSCALAEDHRYRSRLHVLAGTGWTVGDDRFQEQMPTTSGVRFARSHWFARFGGGAAVSPVYRYGRLGRYALAWHGPAGLGTAQGRVAWYSDGDGDIFGAGTFAHEVGHLLSLDHPHGPGLICPEACFDPELTCPVEQDATCRYDAPPSTSGLHCGTVRSTNVPVASLMSYDYLYGPGMLAQNATAPAATAATLAGCVKENLRFSKGLSPSIDEFALNERNSAPSGQANAKWTKLTQDLFCFDGSNDQVGSVGQFSFYPQSGLGPRLGPGYDAATNTFWVNWNSDTNPAADTNSYPYDISGGRTIPGTTICNKDLLTDVNEWGRIFSLSADKLADVPSRDMCVYGDTFNGTTAAGTGILSDFCGWTAAPTAENVVATGVNYPYGGCFYSQGDVIGCSNSPGAECRFDKCGIGLPGCRAGATCLGRDCGCQNDDQCFSGQCVAGVCLREWGACSCAQDSHCETGLCSSDPGQDYCTNYKSELFAFSSPAGPNSNEPQALLESGQFNGTSGRYRLEPGTDRPQETISSPHENTFQWRLDFRHDGFSGDGEHVIVSSGAFSLIIKQVGSESRLDFQVAGQTALTYPPVGGEPLMRGRWYRIVWGAKPGEGQQFAWVRPWNFNTGAYLDSADAKYCVYKGLSTNLPSPGTVWVGHDGSSTTSNYLQGRIDNISLVNYLHFARPKACTQQP